MKKLIFTIFISTSVGFAKPLPCSNKKTIVFAVNLASNKDFVQASKGLDILLSLQSEKAKEALKTLKVNGTAHSEVQDFYTAHYEEHPTEDNATDKIKYYSCKEIKEIMKSEK